MSNKIFSKAQNLGKAFMLPIAVLPAAGLLLGIGASFSNPQTVATYPFLDIPFLQAIFTVMSMAGGVVFANLSLLFAVGIAVGLAKNDKGTAGLAAVLSFLILNITMSALLTINGEIPADTKQYAAHGLGMVLGMATLQTGVFGGIMSGLMTSYLHGRYNKVELPQMLAFFSGSRFIPIVTAFFSLFLGTVLYFIWPSIQSGLNGLGSLVDSSGYFGTFFFGATLKTLIPFGLHHIFYAPFWFSSVGGEMVIQGETVQGAQKIFFAQLADPNTTEFYHGVSRFMTGKFADFMFGLPAAALAMYHCAKPENKKKVMGLLLSGAITSFVTGITEPLEFAFLFAAPLLYVAHIIGVGFAFMLCDMFNVTIGQTFSGGVIDFILFGVMQGNDKTNWITLIPIGLAIAAYYYISFTVLIRWRDLKSPGREDMSDEEQVEGEAKLAGIIEAFGGKSNISDLDCCATRLRVNVLDASNITKDDFKRYGALGTVIQGNGIQVIFGPQVTVIKNQLDDYLKTIS